MGKCSGSAFGGHGEPCENPAEAVIETVNRKRGVRRQRLACEGHARAAMAGCRNTWRVQTTERLPLTAYEPALDGRVA